MIEGNIEANLREVQRRIAEAAERAGRDPKDITLVAITKTFPLETILEGYRLGLRHFGENRVQEAAAKIPEVNRCLSEGLQTRDRPFDQGPRSNDQRPTWHMVGHLQRNKVKKALTLFDIIHSVDSLRLAREISRRAERAGQTVPVLLEVNVSKEATKFGFDLDDKEAFLAEVEQILALPCLHIQGLMTMAPIVRDPEDVRPYFRRLRELRGELRERFPQADWLHLSMGMSDDFEVAIEEGATMVRIGRAIFGERK